jgi:hypothetical protein
MKAPAPDQQPLDLRDIHLPEAISWWPIAPGWWMVLASTILIIASIFILRKIYLKKQLARDIHSELDNIKQQYDQTKNKSQLAKSLSILLRRANISYYPKTDSAGLIGNKWLTYLDSTISDSSTEKKFQSDIGKILLSAPYLPEDASLDFDATKLIRLCESWLGAAHKKTSHILPPGRATS